SVDELAIACLRGATRATCQEWFDALHWALVSSCRCIRSVHQDRDRRATPSGRRTGDPGGQGHLALGTGHWAKGGRCPLWGHALARRALEGGDEEAVGAVLGGEQR